MWRRARTAVRVELAARPRAPLRPAVVRRSRGTTRPLSRLGMKASRLGPSLLSRLGMKTSALGPVRRGLKTTLRGTAPLR